MVQSFAAVIDITMRLEKLNSDAAEDDALHAVAALFQSRANSAPRPCRRNL
jgi:hypothetical protein